MHFDPHYGSISLLKVVVNQKAFDLQFADCCRAFLGLQGTGRKWSMQGFANVRVFYSRVRYQRVFSAESLDL